MHPCILMVEDQVDHRQIVRDLLRSVGYIVLEAATGEEGVTRALTQCPDLMLMDRQLPGIDGYEATRRIKAHPALGHMPIIALTSYALQGDDVKACEVGCQAYISKPCSPRALVATIRTHLG